MDFPAAEQIFNYLYSGVDGYAVSAAGKARLGLADKSLVYGEITLPTFYAILESLPLTPAHQIFYDLGSGTGKAVFGAALLGAFRAALGVELIGELYQTSRRLLWRFNKKIRLFSPSLAQAALVDFIHGDVREHDWSGGDVLFLNSTCFGDEMMRRLTEKLACLKPGSLVITLSIPIYSALFRRLHTQKYPMGWGEATVYVQKKL